MTYVDITKTPFHVLHCKDSYETWLANVLHRLAFLDPNNSEYANSVLYRFSSHLSRPMIRLEVRLIKDWCKRPEFYATVMVRPCPTDGRRMRAIPLITIRVSRTTIRRETLVTEYDYEHGWAPDVTAPTVPGDRLPTFYADELRKIVQTATAICNGYLFVSRLAQRTGAKTEPVRIVRAGDNIVDAGAGSRPLAYTVVTLKPDLVWVHRDCEGAGALGHSQVLTATSDQLSWDIVHPLPYRGSHVVNLGGDDDTHPTLRQRARHMRAESVEAVCSLLENTPLLYDADWTLVFNALQPLLLRLFKATTTALSRCPYTLTRDLVNCTDIEDLREALEDTGLLRFVPVRKALAAHIARRNT